MAVSGLATPAHGTSTNRAPWPSFVYTDSTSANGTASVGDRGSAHVNERLAVRGLWVGELAVPRGLADRVDDRGLHQVVAALGRRPAASRPSHLRSRACGRGSLARRITRSAMCSTTHSKYVGVSE